MAAFLRRQAQTLLRRGLQPGRRPFHATRRLAAQEQMDGMSSSLLAFGMAMAAGGTLMIPVYKLYCQHFGGQVFDQDGIEGPVKDKLLPPGERKEMVTVHFSAETHPSLPVQFVPCQTRMEVLVGEPTLAFFACYNTTAETQYGVATYTIYPPTAAWYFNKLQCFCFEEQRIKPHEYIELPVFFYIEPDFSNDPNTLNASDIILSYTFFHTDFTS
eukprot:EG_transcript_18631